MRIAAAIFIALITVGSWAHATETPSECVQEMSDNFKLSPDSTLGCESSCSKYKADALKGFLSKSDAHEYRACLALDVLSQENPYDNCRWLYVKGRVWELSAIERSFLNACRRETHVDCQHLKGPFKPASCN